MIDWACRGGTKVASRGPQTLVSSPPSTRSAANATKPAAIHTGQLVLRKVPVERAVAIRAKMNITSAAKANSRCMPVSLRPMTCRLTFTRGSRCLRCLSGWPDSRGTLSPCDSPIDCLA
jgi:hypothetical protein